MNVYFVRSVNDQVCVSKRSLCEVWKINENGERMKVGRPATLCWKLEFDGGNG